MNAAPRTTDAPVNNPLAGAAWMIGATSMFAVMAVSIRLLEGQQNALDIAFWRSLIGTLAMLPFMLKGARAGSFRTGRVGLLWVRSFLTYGGMTAYFFAVAEMSSIADAVALNATIPLWTVLLAVMLLPETVGWRRWAATLVGFGGAMLILRPGFQEIGLPAGMALASAACYAGAGIVVKFLARTESTTQIVFYMNLFLVLIAAVPWAVRWNMPDAHSMLWLLVIGASGTLAHVCITKAMRAADASFVAPFDFWRLMLVVLAGWLIFDDPGSIYTWIGGFIVFASAAYVTSREARVARQEARINAGRPLS